MVRSHLIVHGMIQNYTFWYHHGERTGETEEPDSESEDDENEIGKDDEEDEIHEILTDLHPDFNVENMNTDDDDVLEEEPNPEVKRFYSLLKEYDQPLYKGSKLSTLVKLVHIKSIGRWSNDSFNMLLKMLKNDLLPDKSNLPDSYYEARKLIRSLGLSYEKINACKNDCMLYWKNDKFVDSCKICGASRRKENKHSGETRLFMCSKTSSLMRWHHENKANDGIMRHPVDSKAWKKFDELHKSFAMEPRNENFVLSMLIPGPGSPGDAIDVYLQPLIDELNELWETGVVNFDASTKQNFTLHAALLWTINDFPAYANLSGWSTKGKLAFPCCNKETISDRLIHGQKQCYMGHRRFLPLNHKWRDDKKSFDGTTEWRLPPNTLSGDDILDRVADLDRLPLTNDPKKKIRVSHENRESFLKFQIGGLYKHDNSKKMEDLLTLSRVPMKYVTRFKGYIINGYRFHIQDYDNSLRTQNCGIVVVGETDEEDKIIDYYGELTEILELQFIGGRRLVLFRCMWYDVYDKERGAKIDEYDFLCVNPQQFLKTDEPFLLANQASQVFYARDHSNKGWNEVRKCMPHDSFDDMQKNDSDSEDLHDLIERKRKRTHTEKEIGQNFTSTGSVKGSIVVQGTSIGKSKGCSAAYSNMNELASDKNLMQPCLDLIEDET
ncbi:hypothetical protein MTR67_002765 [Solanum verrucosum]|uniref:DUF4216 domain-containing protein n=1 Tax=Solanum verrucosum TaxID=315347 RepID=A0AAF0PT34_SOLVR|nr:hypothetical protein MTR67_002765 [Solanum verrucosum]